MKIRTKGSIIFSVFNTAFMLLIGLVCLYPILYVLAASLSDSGALLAHDGILLLPIKPNLNAYKFVFGNDVILNGYANTLFIVIVGTAISLLLTIVAAYVLSSKDVYWNPLIITMIVLTMYFQGGLVPTYLNIKRLGLYNSIWSVILPVSVNTFNLIIMRTAFSNIPDSLFESAELDGANDFVKLFKIAVPLSVATIAVMVLYYGVAYWNSWFTATMYIRDKAKQPLQVVLREILILNETKSMTSGDGGLNISETVKYATIVVVMFPILTIYPFLQKYFVHGVMVGAVKG